MTEIQMREAPARAGDDAEAALAAARRAQDAWARTPAASRGLALQSAADALESHAEELASLNQRETGRLLEPARLGVRAGIATLRQYAELGPLRGGRTLLGGDESADYCVPRARGVVVALTPWNDPVAIAAGLVGAALVTGNCVVHKPSERCPRVGRLFGDLVAGALPDGVFRTVQGDGRVGAALVDRDDVDGVAHVGSSAAGAAIARSAAAHRIHVTLENGGNDPLIVDEDVDPLWAARQAALGAFADTGQLCTAVERIYVHRGIYREFRDALVAEAREYNRAGALGPLVDRRMRRAVDAQVRDALAAGARALEGGRVPAGPGAYYPATVLEGCTPAMRVMREETFGPLAPLQRVDSFDQALRLASEDAYGLSATVLTASVDHAVRATHLPVGTVKVNAVFGGAPGGSAEPRRASGQGFGYGPRLLDEMTTTSVVHLQAAPPRGGRR